MSTHDVLSRARLTGVIQSNAALRDLSSAHARRINREVAPSVGSGKPFGFKGRVTQRSPHKNNEILRENSHTC